MTNAEVRTKSRELATLVISPERAAANERRVVGLADLDNIALLVDLIAAPNAALD